MHWLPRTLMAAALLAGCAAPRLSPVVRSTSADGARPTKYDPIAFALAEVEGPARAPNIRLGGKRTPPTRWRIPVDPRELRGPVNAPVTVVAFVDYTCAACAPTLQSLSSMARAGAIRLAVRARPGDGPESGRLARIALDARDEGTFWEVHDAIVSGRYPDPAKVPSPASSAALGRALILADRVAAYGRLTLYFNGFRREGAAGPDVLARIVAKAHARDGEEAYESIAARAHQRSLLSQRRVPLSPTVVAFVGPARPDSEVDAALSGLDEHVAVEIRTDPDGARAYGVPRVPALFFGGRRYLGSVHSTDAYRAALGDLR